MNDEYYNKRKAELSRRADDLWSSLFRMYYDFRNDIDVRKDLFKTCEDIMMKLENTHVLESSSMYRMMCSGRKYEELRDKIRDEIYEDRERKKAQTA